MAAIETCRAVVFPWLADQMGHLNTSKYVEMFDVAFHHLVFALGDRPPGDGKLGWADVTQTIDYEHEVPVGALVLITSGVVKLGRTSLTVRHVMTDPGRATRHAVMTATAVRFDLAARKSVPLDDHLRQAAGALMIEEAA